QLVLNIRSASKVVAIQRCVHRRRDARTGGHFIDDLCDDIARPRSAISPSGATHCWIATAVALRRCLSRLRLERRVTTFPKLLPLTSRDPQAAQHRYTYPFSRDHSAFRHFPPRLRLSHLQSPDCDWAPRIEAGLNASGSPSMAAP